MLRIVIHRASDPVLQRSGPIPVSNDAATSVPAPLSPLLGNAASLTGAAFKAQSLSDALNEWSMDHNRDAVATVPLRMLHPRHPDENLPLSLLPILLILGRDLTLLDDGASKVEIE